MYRAVALLLGFVVAKPRKIADIEAMININPAASTKEIILKIFEDMISESFLDELEIDQGKLLNLEIFKEWIPKVRRYSFDWD